MPTTDSVITRVRARSRLCSLLAVSRERFVLSQKDAAQRIGISVQYLCDIEKGRRPFPIHRTKDFARVYGLDAQFLIETATREWLEPLIQNDYWIDALSIQLRTEAGHDDR